MQEQGGGAIVNTGSMASLVGEPNCVSYDSTKGGVLQLSRQMAIDFAKDAQGQLSPVRSTRRSSKPSP